ncbi:hypothetical protein ACW9KT_04800 [Hymenobacter sp. HD11105]
MKMFSKLGFLTLLFSFLSLSCSKEEITKNDNLKTSTSADWFTSCPECMGPLDLIKRVDNKGQNVVLGTVKVCRDDNNICFDYTAKAGSNIGSVQIGLFASFDDLYNRNNTPSPKSFYRTVNVKPNSPTHSECIPLTVVRDLLNLSSVEDLYNEDLAAKLYITAEAQISGSQEGGQAWAGTRVGNGKYPFDRYFVFQFAGCNNNPNPPTCTYTQGFWKNHGPNPSGNNSNEWDYNTNTFGMTLGTITYTASQLQRIFETPVQGNGLISLAHQLIAAKLNVANGASTTIAPTALPGGGTTTSILDVITAANTLIGSRVIPPIGSGSLAPKTTSALTGILGAYNEGTIGPGHCD